MSVLLSSRVASERDDYVAFCDGIRRLTGIDLLQDMRGPLERRIRTFATSRGVRELDRYLRRLGADAAELDAFLDRVLEGA